MIFSSFNILTNQIEENVNYLQDRERSEKKNEPNNHTFSTVKHNQLHNTYTMAAGHIARYIRHAPAIKPHVPAYVKWSSKLLGATMWFWIMLRIKEDGPVMFGLKLPFEHH